MEMLRKILELWPFIGKRRKRQFWVVITFMIFASIAEIFSLGAVLPFLGAITSPEMVYQHPYMQPFVTFLSIESAEQIILPVTCIFIALSLLAGVIRITLVYVLTRFSFATGAELSVSIYRRTLFKPYEEHIDSNSSEVINGVMTKTNTVIGGIIIPTLNGMSSLVLLLSLIVTLVLINPATTMVTFGVFFVLYATIYVIMRNNLHRNGKLIARETTLMLRSLQEGLGGIRDVLIDGTQDYYTNIYKSADHKFRRASGNNIIITSSPRFIMEAVGMALIAGLAYWMFKENDSTTIPLLGALALGAQRMLPVLQNLYSSYGTITGGDASFQDVLDLLKTPLPEHADQATLDLVPFHNSISLNGVSYRYKPHEPNVLSEINLNITKGSSTGFIGQTGCGKSTLLDVIMGLLQPTEGSIFVDDKLISGDESIRAWQKNICHVPQSIYLSDMTVIENIAFGISREHIDEKRVIYAAKKAHIHEAICKLKFGYETMVGEGGARLSGGQIQRIGIARALYKGTSVVILDEATSALDSVTEQKVMEEIGGLGDEVTLLIIAHRLSTLKSCDFVYELSGGKLVEAKVI